MLPSMAHKFMLESNRIEGEDRINPGDYKAYDLACLGHIKSVEDILTIHRTLGGYLGQPWVGKLRSVNVRVGAYIAPNWAKVKTLMDSYCSRLADMNAWVAHNEFQKIHPFQDLNGRVGRLIWLAKMTEEGRYSGISFLQKYYYQTLENYK